MSIEACASLVRSGDPDRFAAPMAAPVSARRVLFPVYGFKVIHNACIPYKKDYRYRK